MSFVTMVGGVVKVQRNINGSNLSTVTIAQGYSGQTCEDGSWSKRQTGYFDFRVWENNLQAGLNSDFTNTMSKLKPGDNVEILAEMTDSKTVKEGKVTYRGITLTALRISYSSSSKAQNTEQTQRVSAVTESNDEGFQEVIGDEPFDGLDPFE